MLIIYLVFGLTEFRDFNSDFNVVLQHPILLINNCYSIYRLVPCNINAII